MKAVVRFLVCIAKCLGSRGKLPCLIKCVTMAMNFMITVMILTDSSKDIHAGKLT